MCVFSFYIKIFIIIYYYKIHKKKNVNKVSYVETIKIIIITTLDKKLRFTTLSEHALNRN